MQLTQSQIRSLIPARERSYTLQIEIADRPDVFSFFAASYDDVRSQIGKIARRFKAAHFRVYDPSGILMDDVDGDET